MRIAFVTDAIHPYNKGGKETRIYELTTRLVKLGHDVHIYTMKWWDTPERTRVENGVTLHAISPKYNLYHGDRRSISEGILFGLATLKLVSARFDVVDVDHMPYFPLFFMKAVCLIKRKPMVATWHEVWGKDYWNEYLGRMGIIASTLERLSVRMPNSIVAVSPHTAARLESVLHAEAPVSQVVNGIDLNAIAALVPATETSDIIFAGRLLPHKNVDQLLRAIAAIRSTRPNIKVIILGDGPERDRLLQLAFELGITGNVIFKGFVSSDAQKLRLMKASKVFVSASTREGFGIAALEAMACGLPVVTVNHPDNAARNLINSATGLLCEPNDPLSLAVAIDTVLSDDVSHDPAGAVSTYDWNLSVSAVAKVYAQ